MERQGDRHRQMDIDGQADKEGNERVSERERERERERVCVCVTDTDRKY